MRYDAHERLVAPARDSASLTKLLGGCVMTFLIFGMVGQGLASMLWSLTPEDDHAALSRALEHGTTPGAALLTMYYFAAWILALAVAVQAVHGRSLLRLLGPPRETLVQCAVTIAAVVAVQAVVALIPNPPDLAATRNMAFGNWIMILPLALIGLAIQVSAEELMFRGYMQSQLAARFANPVIWLAVPSAIFAALHYAPAAYGASAWLVVIWAGLFGVAAADLTARSGTLGPAIGLHLVNNVSAILLVAPKGNLDGLALYTYPFSLTNSAMVSAWMPVDIMLLLCSWLAARLALRR